MSDNDSNYTQSISTADFGETPTLSIEKPTSDIYVEGWDRQEISVTAAGSQAGFELEQRGSEVFVRNRPSSYKAVTFVGPMADDLKSFGFDVERTASRVEREVERVTSKVERKLKHLNKGINIEIDLGRWAGGQDYNIRVPHNCHLTLRTSSGDITVRGVNGTMYLHSTSGDVRIHDVSGSILLQSASGDIKGDNVEGRIGISTASGDIRLEHSAFDEVNAQTASGDLNLEMRRVPSRDFNIRTVSGDLNLFLPEETRLTAEVHTLSGDIRCGYSRSQVHYTSSGKRNTTLEINGGGVRAQLQSVSGDVSIKPRDFADYTPAPRVEQGAEPVFTSSPSSTPSQETVRTAPSEGGESGPAFTTDLSRAGVQPPAQGQQARVAGGETGSTARQQAELSILQAVERGELTPTEALRQLSALDGE